MVSDVDARRIESGEFESVEEVLHASDAPAPSAKGRGAQPTSSQKRRSRSSSTLSARDRDILDEVPPHFGNL
ncbi:Uncharacterised protein [Trueperella bialowiezensis]|uniref:Uncharacterized protein n=2 Tax=Trueperella bialowiezensis TaxID=312285 RepID=A0A3S4Z500_9ACTO|nr:Uncharacterised protein [Trueperella bialowiezensis]